VDAFLLEYDSDRAGGFEPLRLVPRNKTVVLGLVTTKEAKLESQDELRRRIDEAARYVPLENLALSPQCGFASVAAGNLLSIDDQWRKLELVVETARKVWGSPNAVGRTPSYAHVRLCAGGLQTLGDFFFRNRSLADHLPVRLGNVHRGAPGPAIGPASRTRSSRHP
jgi:hypothetical protein